MLGLLAALASFLTWQAFWSPAIEFLPPAWRGAWIVHPQPPIPFHQRPDGLVARFAHRFSLATVPDTALVRVTAMESFAMTVNGTELEVPHPATWKRSVAIDLAGALRPGLNEIVVAVRNPRGPTALLVQGAAFVRSATNWTVAVGPKFGSEQSAVAAGTGESYRHGRPHPLRATRAWPWCVAAAVVWVGFLVFAVIPWRSRLGRSLALHPPPTDIPRTGGRGSHRAASSFRDWAHRHAVGLLIVLAAGVVHFHNARTYPHTRSPFDVGGHVEYIRHVARTWQVPTARDGWEMYQPPLYYFAAAGVYRLAGGAPAEPSSLKAVQHFSAAVGFAGLLAAWWLLSLLFPARPGVRHFGLAVVAMLPMALYLNPMITNEVFAATVITATIALAVRLLKSRWLSSTGLRLLAPAILIGLACGAALLGKYTGLLIGVSVLVVLASQAIGDRRAWWPAVAFTVTVLLVAGWVYGRNLHQFGDPFIGNWDEASGHHYEQHPGYRTLTDYTRFGRVLAERPQVSAYLGFWDGLYGSAWTDGHGAFLRWNKDPPVILATAILWLALLPTTAMLLGFARTVRDLWRGDGDLPWLLLVLVSVLSVAALISFTMELPFFSTVKAFFLLSLAGPAGAFAARGFETMAARLGRACWLIHLDLVVLAGLIGWQFWYP